MTTLLLKLNNFNGPIDVLFELISKKKVKIEDINLIELCNQYLQFIMDAKNNNIDLASEYLNEATHLMKVKINILLPKPDEDINIEERESIEREKLIKRLVEYQKYKSTLEFFKNNYEDRRHQFSKEICDLGFLNEFYDKQKKEKDEEYNYSGLNLDRLSKYMYDVLVKYKKQFENTNKVINIDTLTPQEQSLKIMKYLNESDVEQHSLFEFCKNSNLIIFIISFLALLELAKNNKVLLTQSNNNSNIIFMLKNEK